ncbi:MAG: hypothetical protein ABH870_01525 [bacterium]
MENNLDLKCAECGSKIAKNKEDEKLITKALGVLQEDGVYAFFLYLKSQKEKAAEWISERTFSLLKTQITAINAEKEPLPAIRDKLADNLDSLLLAKQLLEKALVYARYHAKAL